MVLLDLEKMHKMVELACEGLAGVSASQVEIQSGIQFYDGITTAEIQGILVKSASDLITRCSKLSVCCARLLLFGLRKNLYGRIHEVPTLIDQFKEALIKEYMIGYTQEVFQKEIETLDNIIDHSERDYLFTYAGLRQVVDKYLVQDRSTGEVYETPQFMYMLIAMTIFAEYPP